MEVGKMGSFTVITSNHQKDIADLKGVVVVVVVVITR
jgi:hypothetical protein